MASTESEYYKTTTLEMDDQNRSCIVSNHDKKEYKPVVVEFSQAQVRAKIMHLILAIDAKISAQLDSIIHNDKFQALESAWRGIYYLVDNSAKINNIKIKLLSITWQEITKDIDRVIDIEHSNLFQKIYSEEFGTPGGEPYGILLGDYYVQHISSTRHPYDMATLHGLAQIASAAFCPFITGASPQLLGLEDFKELERPIDFHRIFTNKEYLSFHRLQSEPDVRFVALVLPRILMRDLYRYPKKGHGGLYYQETVDNGVKDILWGNACYALGQILIREFQDVGWFSHIRGSPRNKLTGGMVVNLQKNYLNTDKHQRIANISTDVIISDQLEKQLDELGFISLCQCYGSPYLAFHNNSSLYAPKHTLDVERNVNDKLASMLQHVLCGARVAHYIKVMIRDKVGSFLSAEDCQKYLQKWLFKYTTGGSDLSWESQARTPLKEAKVQVNENLSKPGHYWCEIKLKPHYQADQLVSELKIVTEMNQVSS